MRKAKTSPSGCLAFLLLDGLGCRSLANYNEISWLQPDVFRGSGVPEMIGGKLAAEVHHHHEQDLAFSGVQGFFSWLYARPCWHRKHAAYVKIYNIYTALLHSSFSAPD